MARPRSRPARTASPLPRRPRPRHRPTTRAAGRRPVDSPDQHGFIRLGLPPRDRHATGRWLRPKCRPAARSPNCPWRYFFTDSTAATPSCWRTWPPDEALQRHLDAGGAPFAIAAVDGGNTWWHPRADGSDTQSMLVKEFVPFLASRGYDLGRIGLFGLSMGGFGSLLLASQGRLPGVRAVAAMSPAVWDHYDPRHGRRLRRPGRLRGPRRVRAPAPARGAAQTDRLRHRGRPCRHGSRTTAPDCRARSRAASSPAATTTATGVPSCPRCCPSSAATSPEPAAPRSDR